MVFPSLVKNTFFQALAKLVSVLGGIVLTYFLGQRFGESGFGVYTFVMSFVLFFGSLSDWGTTFITVREASQTEDTGRRKIFSTVLITRLLLSVLGFVAVNIIIRIDPTWADFSMTAGIASLVLFFLSLKTSLSIIFQTRLRFDLISLIEVLSTVVFVGLSLYFVFSGGGINLVMLAWVVSTVIAFFTGLLFAGDLLTPLSFSRPTAHRILSESFPTGALLVVSTVYNRADILILQHFHTTSDVGVYGMAYKVYETVVFGASYIVNSMFPLLSHMYSKVRFTADLKRYFRRAYIGIAITGVVLAFFVYWTSPIIPSVFDGKFNMSTVPLKILSFAVIFSYLNHLVGYSLIAFGRQKIALTIAVLALVFNISLNLLFVPTYSYVASAYLTIATEALVLLISGFAVFKLFSNAK